MTDQTPTPEGVQNTLREYLRVAATSGELRGTRVEFSGDGVEWVDVWLGSEPPVAARATVYRDGWVIPTVVTAVWADSLPADDTWRELWQRKWNVLFGAFVLRASLARTFPELLGDRREPDDLPTGEPTLPDAPRPPAAEPATDAAEPTVERVPWLQRVADARTEQEVEAIREEARGQRAIDPELHMAMKARLRDLAAQQAKTFSVDEPAKPAPKPSALDAVPAPTAIAVAMQAAQAARAEADAKAKTPATPRTRVTRKQG